LHLELQGVRDEINGNVDADKLDGLAACEGVFAGELGLSCMFGLP
jgi:hypothetical protein